jgi:FkbM family methyltransferase
MNRLERMVDEVDPGLSARMRALKMRLRHDVCRRLIHTMMGASEVGVDVGANRGVYTYLMSSKVGAQGRVHAVEPFPANGARLRTIAGRRPNITVHAVAASDHSGDGELRVPVHDGHSIDALASLRPDQAGQQETGRQESCVVQLRTLDELLEGERRVSFLKCDVEGHEQQVFEGAARILDRDRPVVFAEVEARHRKDPIENTFAFFDAAGYRGWFVAGSELRPLREFDVARDQLGYLDGRFMPYTMPDGYVHDFLFCPPGIAPPTGLEGS